MSDTTKTTDTAKPTVDTKTTDTAKPTVNTNAQTTLQIAALFIFAWAALGLAAFIWSLVCFKKSGTIEQKVLGLLMAIFIGPLFFIYYKYSPTYCK